MDTRLAFLEERKKFVGGSDSSSLFSEGYGCQRRLIMDKRGVPDDYQHGEKTLQLFERGQELEDIIAEKFVHMANHLINDPDDEISIRRSKARIHPEHPYIGVNIDRQIVNVNGDNLFRFCPELKNQIVGGLGPGVLECKSANEWVFKKFQYEGLLPDYALQMQHALAVTGYKWGVFTVLEPSSWQFVWFGVRREEELIQSILNRSKQVWKLVEDTTLELPPKLDIKDKRCANCTKRRTCRGDELLQIQKASEGEETSTPTIYDKDESLADLVIDYNTAGFAVQNAEFVRDEIKKRLIEQIGEREKVEVPSAGVKISYSKSKDSLIWDGKALDADHPELAVKYKKPKKGSRTLRMYWL